MAWKRHNPGCPCCCPCACYKFNGDGDAACQGLDLTATSASYGTGKFVQEDENEAANFTGSAYFEHEDKTCFNLGETDPRIIEREGINVWFWLRANHDAPYSWELSTTEPEGIVSKGDWDKSGHEAYDFDGEWGIFWDSTSPSDEFVGNVWFLVGNGSGNPYDANRITKGAKGDNAYETAGNKWEFYFFWVSIYEGKVYVIKDDEDTEEESLSGTQTKVSDKKLYVGNNTEGKKLGEQTYGGVARPWLLDNVGFCKEIGTKEEMEERAANLYNDGEGRVCNHAGLTDSECC